MKSNFQNFKPLFYIGLLLISGSITSKTFSQSDIKSEWINYDASGKLQYKTLPKGDKIMDFSSAGYMGGGVMIPEVPVKITVNPDGVNDAANIQAAIDKVSAMPLVNGFRGAVLLKAGVYNCDTTININSEGVVLRGSGMGKDGTIINIAGEPHRCISIKGKKVTKVLGKQIPVTDDYIPSGATSFNVANPSSFSVGDVIRIKRPVTDAWLHLMEMDSLYRDGKKQGWLGGDLNREEVITKIKGTEITIETPLSDNFDAQYLGKNGTTVVKISNSGEISQIGVENLRIVAVPKAGTIWLQHSKGIEIAGAKNCWLRNLDISNCVGSILITGQKITVENLNLTHEIATEGAAGFADIQIDATGKQVLVNKCASSGPSYFYFATGSRVMGPNVLLNCTFKGNGSIQPHARWATGVLIDGCTTEGGLEFMNRGIMGSGHGWAIGWAVAWNCTAKDYLNQMPPGAANWVIGCKGSKYQKPVPGKKAPLLPEGIYDAHGTKVFPKRLYLAQLSERLGKKVLKNIGY